MANEISVTANLTASKGGLSITPGAKTKQITMAGVNMDSGSFTTHASANTSKQITFGGVGSAIPGYLRITNLDDTAIVTLSGTTAFTAGEMGATLLPSHFALWPPTENALWCRSNLAAIQLEVTVVDL